MEIRNIKILFIIACSLFYGCDKYDLRNMLVSYEHVNERFAESMNLNDVNGFKVLNVVHDEYRIYFAGDSHVGGIDNLNKFFHAAQIDGLAAVVAGDLCTGKAEAYQRYADALPSGLHVFSTPGNHDLYFRGWQSFKTLLGSAVYRFFVVTPSGTDVFISLDSGSGTLGSMQLKWLTEFLENERKNYRRCVIFTHVNILRIRNTTSTNPQSDEVHLLINLFALHRVDLFVNGHDHKRNVKVLGDTQYITLDALLDGFKRASYMVLTVENGVLGFEFKPVP